MPATPGIKTSGWAMSSNVGLSISPFDRSTQVQEWAGEMWKIQVTLPVMQRSKAGQWLGFFASLHGPANPFMIGPETMASPQGVATGVPVVNGLNNGGFTLSTRGWTPSKAGILQMGDFIQVGNRLYMMASTEDSDAGGIANFDIWPSIREIPGDGDPIIIASPKGMFRLAQADIPFDVDEAGIFQFSFSAIEAI